MTSCRSMSNLKRPGSLKAQRTMISRKNGVDLCRLTLARMYGRSDIWPDFRELIRPFVTDQNTLGFVDIAAGIAWDSSVMVSDDLQALTQARVPRKKIDAPSGWSEIRLNFTSEDQDSCSTIPPSEYRPEYWLRPRLRAVGLMTYSHEVGLPSCTLSSTSGDCAHYPHGMPPWVSTTRKYEEFDWLPLSDEQRTQIRQTFVQFALLTLQSLVPESPWPEKLQTALLTYYDANLGVEKFAELLLRNLKKQGVRREYGEAFVLPVVSSTAWRTMGFAPEMRAVVTKILYPNGSIYLDMPALDASALNIKFGADQRRRRTPASTA